MNAGQIAVLAVYVQSCLRLSEDDESVGVYDAWEWALRKLILNDPDLPAYEQISADLIDALIKQLGNKTYKIYGNGHNQRTVTKGL